MKVDSISTEYDDIINEFTRLMREIIRNSIQWGKANFLKVEISKGRVSLFDNSGSCFDIFNPDGHFPVRDESL
jgi:hypothetical protein